MKTILILLLLVLSSFVYAQDTLNFNEDKQVIGVIKIYLIEGEKYFTKVTYVDTTELKYGGFTLYDIVFRSYLHSFPLLYPELVIQDLRENFIRFKDEYGELNGSE